MSKREFRVTDASRGAALPVQVIPHTKRTKLIAIEDDGTLTLQLCTPPSGDQNEQLVDYLADLFEVRFEDVQIVAGFEGNKKVIAVLNASASEIDRLIHQTLDSQG
jgi:uncharacterized protein YggU (UPF0235/DUF167 family)